MIVCWDILYAHLNSKHSLSHLVFLVQSPEDLWLSAAQKLTNVIKQIIEFAKLVPGFLKLPQEDIYHKTKNISSDEFGSIQSF